MWKGNDEQDGAKFVNPTLYAEERGGIRVVQKTSFLEI